MDLPERQRICREYVDTLEVELHKIEVFQRDLPLSVQLVTNTVEYYRRQMESEMFMGRSECEMEETSIHGPVLEEFLPLKPNSSSSEEEHDNSQNHHDNNQEQQHQVDRSQDKPDWLRSVQLGNQDSLKKDLPIKPIAVEAKKIGGAFHPFQREKPASEVTKSVLEPVPAATAFPAPVPAATASSTADTGGGGGGVPATGTSEVKEGQSHRKARRCWSPELHRRFVQALQQLGGSHVATPKQVRELMKVDGLTNDEVKSHLQKYRLHTRRPSPAVHANNSSQQAPQFVLVGGIWVPPPEYAAAGAAAAAKPTTKVNGALPNGMYAPKASLPLEAHSKPQKRSQGSPKGPLPSGEPGSLGDDGATTSISPASSSSSDDTATTTSTSH